MSVAGSRGVHRMRQGKAHAKLGQWTKAYAAYAKALELGAKGAQAALADAAEHGGGPPPGSEPTPAPSDTKAGDDPPPSPDDAEDDPTDDAPADPTPAPADAPAAPEEGA